MDDCDSLLSLSLPNLTAVTTAGFTTSNSDLLASLSLASGVAFSGGMGCGSCPNLTTLTLAGSTFADVGQTIDFNGDNLDTGSVDAVLARCNASGLTTATIDLSGGTNASPTGGILNPDYVGLTGAGCTVLIN